MSRIENISKYCETIRAELLEISRPVIVELTQENKKKWRLLVTPKSDKSGMSVGTLLSKIRKMVENEGDLLIRLASKRAITPLLLIILGVSVAFVFIFLPQVLV